MAEQRPRLPRLAEKSRQRAPVDHLLRPFAQLARKPTLGGGLLVAATVVAVVWANSPWAEQYQALLHTKFAIGDGEAPMSKPLILWINDLLMALFFLLVGLEIKREAMVGELRSIRKAALPLVAAAGGMAIPGLMYAGINLTSEGGAPHGWGVAVATDIAFALGLLALLGRRIPASIRVFLATLAIADDIGALLVIALFYTEQLGYNWLAWAGAALLGLIAMNRLGVRHPTPYFLVGLALWYFTFKSGVHATIAGVLMAATIPATRRVDSDEFLSYCRSALDSFERSHQRDQRAGHPELISGDEQAAVEAVEDACSLVEPALPRLERILVPWVAFAIVPIFALANAGVAVSAETVRGLCSPVGLGIVLGLAIGKPVGIVGACWLAVKLGVARLPDGVRWGHIVGTGILAGIGFTMSLFIAVLAFSDAQALEGAKLAVLTASILAAAGGLSTLWWVSRPARGPQGDGGG
jgi:NhaA family Na+:H+ antiporter